MQIEMISGEAKQKHILSKEKKKSVINTFYLKFSLFFVHYSQTIFISLWNSDVYIYISVCAQLFHWMTLDVSYFYRHDCRIDYSINESDYRYHQI